MGSDVRIRIGKGEVLLASHDKTLLRQVDWPAIALILLVSVFLSVAQLEAAQVPTASPQTETPRVDTQFSQIPGLNQGKFDNSSDNSLIRNPLLQDLQNSNLAPVEEEEPCQMKARYHLEKDTNRGYLILSMQLAKGAYIHSLTLSEDLNPTKITVSKSDDYRVGEKFQSDREPAVVERDPVFQRRMEKHFDTVQFFVPLEIRPNVDLAKCHPQIIFDGQVCTQDGICIALRKRIVQASFGGYFERTANQSSRNQN